MKFLRWLVTMGRISISFLHDFAKLENTTQFGLGSTVQKWCMKEMRQQQGKMGQ